MGKIHTFQKYSQRENWVTNNTLLFLSRFQKYNNLKFEKLINAILEENNVKPLDIGVHFLQQEKGLKSVLDGTITQKEFKIYIETKLFDNFSVDQLIRHLESITDDNGQNRILLALAKSEVSNEIRSEVVSIAKEKGLPIKFASTTFFDLIEFVRENIAEYEIEMNELIEEYAEFCRENDLFRDDSEYMLVLTAGKSIKENLKYHLYYDPVERRHNTAFSKIGLYTNKAIIAIGDFKYAVSADLINDELKIIGGEKITDEEKDRIKQIHYHPIGFQKS